MKIRITEQLHEAQGKYVYFLLAVAASAIAFVVQKTEGKALTLDLIPLGVAVLLWAGSFTAGCFNRAYFGSTLFANINLLNLQDRTHPDLPPRQYVEAACEGVREAAQKNSASASFWGRWQFRLLIAGAIFFLAWHVLQMAAIPVT